MARKGCAVALLSTIVSYLNTYLSIDAYNDGIWNGLQIEGKQEIKKVVCAVDAGLETFQRTVTASGDLLIVHHGHFLKSINPSLVGWQKKRLAPLLEQNISLYAAHLPLDAHPEVGNNTQLFKIIGAVPEMPFASYEGKHISWVGSLAQAQNITIITGLLNNILATTCKVLPFGPSVIKRVAICSGGGGYKLFSQAVEAGVDLYITGDTIEIYHLAKDAGINVIFAGHYATETLGVKALGKHVAAQFGVDAEFIDVPTGL